jgi:hypothetical protein
VPDPPELYNGHLLVVPPVVGFQVGNRQYSVPEIIGQDTLQFIVERMEANDRRQAQGLLAALVQDGTVGKSGIGRDVRSLLLEGKDSASLEKLVKLDRLSDFIRRELRRRSITFIRTPTLRDRIDPQSAEDIFTLGEYVARLNQVYIDCFLDKLRQPGQLVQGGGVESCGILPGMPPG